MNTSQRRIELEICRFLKHLGSKVVEELPERDLSRYLCDILNSHGGPCPSEHDIAERLERIKGYRKQLKVLLSQPQVAQRSQEWFDMRKNRLTASDLAQAMNKGKFGNRQQLLTKKAFPESAAPFPSSNPALQWGVMFEPMASRCYAQRHHDVEIHEFGLIPHSELACFGASPDGITEHGIMLEFKCPLRRKIDGNIPEQYAIQMQGQMAVCGLSECDYVECDMHRLSSVEEYEALVPSNERMDHGIILDHGDSVADGGDRYCYSAPYLTPSEAVQWMRTVCNMREHATARVVFWKLRKIHIARVVFDAQQWGAMVPHITAFWHDVEATRALPVVAEDAPPPSTKKKRPATAVLEFIEDEDDPAS